MSFVLLGGCSTSEYRSVPLHDEAVVTAPVVEAKKKDGVYHKVVKGQTLWRIAKAYGVPVEDIIAGNNIPNAAAIEVDQLILIPGAAAVQEIPVRTADENKEEFSWPLKGKVLSYFNDRRGEAVSRGIDIEASEGETVKAVREGVVVMSDYMAGYGQTLMLDHGDGFITVYAQNRILLARLGTHVFKGDPVAEVGRVGRKSFLHFELRKGEKAVNPLYYLP